MLRAVRRNLRAVIRYSVLLVLLGLGTVPVECAAVYGPHSIFISAEAVANMRDGDHHHSHAPTTTHATMADMKMSVEHAAAPDVHPSDSHAVKSATAGTTSLPTPAGTTVDALIAVALFENDNAPGPRDFATISWLLPLPTGDLLPAPEPPPPQLGA